MAPVIARRAADSIMPRQQADHGALDPDDPKDPACRICSST